MRSGVNIIHTLPTLSVFIKALLFSATFPRKVEYLAREVTENPVRISVGTTGQANEDITQVIIVLDDEMLKWDWVIRQLPRFCSGKRKTDYNNKHT